MPRSEDQKSIIRMAWFSRCRSAYFLQAVSVLVVLQSCCLLVTEARKYCDAKNPEITKTFDKTCDKDFFFCVPGIGGIPANCPESLVFNPKRENCDIPHACRDNKEVDRDCVGKPCGLHADPGCETYFICSGGNKIRKRCPDGFFFDTDDKDCKDPVEGVVVCFDEVKQLSVEPTDIQDDATYSLSDHDFCPEHTYTASPGAPPADSGSGIILEAPKVTDWGTWNDWVHCPKGTYADSLSLWKRSVEDDRKKFDHGGVVSIGFKCEDPLEIKKNSPNAGIIGQFAKDCPDHKWFGWLECEKGAVVGYQLSQQKDQGTGAAPNTDDTATDNVKIYCSCGKKSELFKPYHLKKPIYNKVGNQRGEWTQPMYCDKKQVICGLRTQMQDWVQTNIVKLEKEDMTGLNQMHTKCCDVPSPALCAAKETLMYIQRCDNSAGKTTRPCPVRNILVGVAYNKKDLQDSVSFYTSIGYKLEESVSILKNSIDSNVQCEGECGANYEKLDSSKLYRVGRVEDGEVNIQGKVDGRVHQVVVLCGIFKIYTNTLVVKGTKKGGEKAEDKSFVI